MLLASLFAVLTMAVLCASLLHFSGSVAREQATGIDDVRALYLAEAGLGEGFTALYAGKDGNVGSETEPARYGLGVLWVEATDLGGGRVALRSTGLSGMGRSCLELVVQLGELELAALGVFGDEELVLEPGAVADSYDSTVGSYVAQATYPRAPEDGGHAVLASNGPVVLQEGATVYGDVTPGEGFGVTLASDAVVTGSTVPAGEPFELPEVVVPELTTQGGLTLAAAGASTIPAGSVRYDALVLQEGSQLTLTGPLEIVVDSLTATNASNLVFDTANGPVDLYVLGDLELAAGSLLTSPNPDPAQAVIYALGNSADPAGGGEGGPGAAGEDLLGLDLGQTVEDLEPWSDLWLEQGWVRPVLETGEPADTCHVEAAGTFYGFIYGPDAELRVPGGIHVLGGVTARRLTLGTGSRVSFDSSLVGGASRLRGKLSALAWSIQELPDSPLVKLRIDPLTQLARLAITPVRSADAHHQDGFYIVYEDALGITRTYLGIEEQFDWSAVDQVVDLNREGDPNDDPWPKVDANAATLLGREAVSDGQTFFYDAAGALIAN